MGSRLSSLSRVYKCIGLHCLRSMIEVTHMDEVRNGEMLGKLEEKLSWSRVLGCHWHVDRMAVTVCHKRG